VAGEKYAKFLQENLFGPLGMADTGVDQSGLILAKRAQGYEGVTAVRHAGYIDMTIPFSAGSLYSTTGDLLKWERGLFGGKVLKPESLKKMTTPFKQDYAFGLEATTLDGYKEFMHGGAIEGFRSSLAFFPDAPGGPLTVVVLGNQGGAAQDISERLANLAFKAHK
jgi:CubicO group peptidase (beta-lactamase class C family)